MSAVQHRYERASTHYHAQAVLLPAPRMPIDPVQSFACYPDSRSYYLFPLSHYLPYSFVCSAFLVDGLRSPALSAVFPQMCHLPPLRPCHPQSTSALSKPSFDVVSNQSKCLVVWPGNLETKSRCYRPLGCCAKAHQGGMSKLDTVSPM